MSVDTFQLGTQTLVAKQDWVKVLASPGKRDGFEALVMGAQVDDDGQVCEVAVFGARGQMARAHRTFRPERIQPVSAARAAKLSAQLAHQKELEPYARLRAPRRLSAGR